jgi:hypothetical protein
LSFFIKLAGEIMNSIPIGILAIGSELPKLGSTSKPDFTISPTFRFLGANI